MREKITFYVYFGLYHPRLREKFELDHKFFEVGNETEILLLQNLINYILSSKEKDIVYIYKKFLTDRALDYRDNNHMIKKLNNIMKNFMLHFNGKKSTAMTMYLLKTKNKKLIDIEKTWPMFRK